MYMEMFWDNDAVFKQRLIGTHTMSLGPGLFLSLCSAPFHILTLCLDSSSSKIVVVGPVYRFSGSTLSFFCVYPRILRKVFTHLIHSDWYVLYYCLFLLSDQCDVMLWLI